MWELRDRPVRRMILSPLGDGGSLILCLVSVLVIVGGNGAWPTVAAVCVLLVFFGRSYAASLRADATGVAITNRFFRWRVPWSEVRGIWVPEPTRYEFIRVLRIERRRGRFFGVSAAAALGLSQEQLGAAARELAEFARQHGHLVFAASETEDAKRSG